MRKVLSLLLGCFIAGCSDLLTFPEADLINEGEGIMRVCKIDNQADSLFLRKIARPLNEKELKMAEFRKLKERMLATVQDPSDEGVGIAAPQVGISRQLIAVQRYDKTGEPFEFFINPRIEYYSETKSLGGEGCLSVPDIVGEVWRSDEIVISYIPDGEEIVYKRRQDTVRGFTAVIFQHEIDHLNGVLFIDKMEKK